MSEGTIHITVRVSPHHPVWLVELLMGRTILFSVGFDTKAEAEKYARRFHLRRVGMSFVRPTGRGWEQSASKRREAAFYGISHQSPQTTSSESNVKKGYCGRPNCDPLPHDHHTERQPVLQNSQKVLKSDNFSKPSSDLIDALTYTFKGGGDPTLTIPTATGEVFTYTVPPNFGFDTLTLIQPDGNQGYTSNGVKPNYAKGGVDGCRCPIIALGIVHSEGCVHFKANRGEK